MKRRLLLFLTGRHLAILAFALILYLPASAQTPQTINGTLTDSVSAEPLIGVSVSIQGTTTGTQTDVKGHFSINASRGATLVFRYIGYNEKHVSVGDNTIVNIKLASSSQGIKRSCCA
jgi:hypothetical protein